SYMHRYSKNYDLRLRLMESAMQQYRDDPLVHWAAGVCHMNASEFGKAIQELQRALVLGLDLEQHGIGRQHVLIRIMLAAAMEGDPEETLQWVRDTQLGDDEELQGLYADMLSRLYRYEE